MPPTSLHNIVTVLLESANFNCIIAIIACYYPLLLKVEENSWRYSTDVAVLL